MWGSRGGPNPYVLEVPEAVSLLEEGTENYRPGIWGVPQTRMLSFASWARKREILEVLKLQFLDSYFRQEN